MTQAVGKSPSRVVELTHRVEWSALAALFWLSLRQLVRGRRLLVLSFLFTLPIIVAILARNASHGPPTDELEFVLVLTLIPNALAPLAALIYASGMIQDEVEEQTLTYLLVRPLPKWGIYLAKLTAIVLLTIMLAGLFTLATFAVIYWGTPNIAENVVPRAAKAVCLLDLSLVGYCSLFGCLSLFERRSLLIGVVYIAVFEGLLANIDFVARRLTVMYYFRVLTERWLIISPKFSNIDLAEAPSNLECVATILLGSLAATAIGATLFCTREFRMKTPEGN